MLIKTKAIVLSSIRFNDKSLIVKCFTQSDGIKSYFVRDAFSTKKNNHKIAYFQPLTILEIEATHKKNVNLNYFKEIHIAVPFQTVYTDFVKSTIVMFIAEILYHSIHEEEQNNDLFVFIETALLWLDQHDDSTNFHLIFTINITKFLGFYPDISNIDYSFFDYKEGNFVPTQSATSLAINETILLKKLLNLSFENVEKTFVVEERQCLLKILIDYFKLHLDGFKEPKSIAIFKEVFA